MDSNSKIDRNKLKKFILTALPNPSPDFVVKHKGSIILLHAHSEAARMWVEMYISREGFQPDWPEVVIVEQRYLTDVVAGICEAGLDIR